MVNVDTVYQRVLVIANTEYSDAVNIIEEKINIFETSVNIGSTYSSGSVSLGGISNLYRLGSVQLDGIEIEKLEHKDFKVIDRTPLT